MEFWLLLLLFLAIVSETAVGDGRNTWVPANHVGTWEICHQLGTVIDVTATQGVNQQVEFSSSLSLSLSDILPFKEIHTKLFQRDIKIFKNY